MSCAAGARGGGGGAKQGGVRECVAKQHTDAQRRRVAWRRGGAVARHAKRHVLDAPRAWSDALRAAESPQAARACRYAAPAPGRVGRIPTSARRVRPAVSSAAAAVTAAAAAPTSAGNIPRTRTTYCATTGWANSGRACVARWSVRAIMASSVGMSQGAQHTSCRSAWAQAGSVTLSCVTSSDTASGTSRARSGSRCTSACASLRANTRTGAQPERASE